jgi:hypothetical protein
LGSFGLRKKRIVVIELKMASFGFRIGFEIGFVPGHKGTKTQRKSKCEKGKREKVKGKKSEHRGAVAAVCRDGSGSSAVLREAAIRFLQWCVGATLRSA